MQGATGVVLNAPTASTVVARGRTIDIPVVLTVVRADADDERIRAGADIFNVSAAAETPAVVRRIREQHPDVPIIATGGPTDGEHPRDHQSRRQRYHVDAAVQRRDLPRHHGRLPRE